MEWANLTAWHTLDIKKKQLPPEGVGIRNTFHLTVSEPLALVQAFHQVLKCVKNQFSLCSLATSPNDPEASTVPLREISTTKTKSIPVKVWEIIHPL